MFAQRRRQRRRQRRGLNTGERRRQQSLRFQQLGAQTEVSSRDVASSTGLLPNSGELPQAMRTVRIARRNEVDYDTAKIYEEIYDSLYNEFIDRWNIHQALGDIPGDIPHDLSDRIAFGQHQPEMVKKIKERTIARTALQGRIAKILIFGGPSTDLEWALFSIICNGLVTDKMLGMILNKDGNYEEKGKAVRELFLKMRRRAPIAERSEESDSPFLEDLRQIDEDRVEASLDSMSNLFA